MFRIDSDGATVDNKFTDTPAPGQNATVVSAEWLNAVQEEIVGFLEANGVTLAKADNTQLATLMATLFAAAKKVAGDYEIETVVIPGSDNKKLTVTNKQAGKQFTITETRGPAGTTVEATHSLGAVASGIDYIFDFSLHNYSGSMKGVFVLSVFNSDAKLPIYWVLKRRPTGQSGYGETEDHYMMRLTETNGLEINTGGEVGPTPTWSKVLTEANRSQFATAAQGAKADTALQNAGAFATAAQGAKADTLSGKPGTYEDISIGSGESWYPVGTYVWVAANTDAFYIQIYNGSSWVGLAKNIQGGTIMGDGSTTRIINGGGTTYHIYARKMA